MMFELKKKVMKYRVTASIVLYKNPPSILLESINSFLNAVTDARLVLVDNSPTPELEHISADPRIEYIFNNRNIGFGAAHNIAIKKVSGDTSYHLILNPDISFPGEALTRALQFMDTREDVGLVMPKILYDNGDIQYLCKLLPTPFDLIMRRFIPGFLTPIFGTRLNKYELKHMDYNVQMEVPSLSGCFMLVRTKVLEETLGFDERYFMYLEDVDLVRRIGQHNKTVYFPESVVYHRYEKGSYRSRKLLFWHIRSAVQYFNKWGWFLDRERARINRKYL